MTINVNSRDLLYWYDTNARKMPWRIPPKRIKKGEKPDPYKIWLSEIMLQQTTVATVESYFINFISMWPKISDLANANDDKVMAAWAGLGYYARARNLLKCARIVVSEFNRVFPTDINDLQTLPGIGPYTSAAIAAIAFDKSETVMDGNVERVISRIYAIQKPLPKAKALLFKGAEKITPKRRAGDYAQAIMDLGSTVCLPKNPRCDVCPWKQSCLGKFRGIESSLPIKIKKKLKPLRYGIIYVAKRRDGSWLLERREPKGLLGGMLGWPGSEWSGEPYESAPVVTTWVTSKNLVRHVFSHFTLQLKVKVAIVPENIKPTVGFFYNDDQFIKSDLPKLMQKVFDVALLELKKNPASTKAG